MQIVAIDTSLLINLAHLGRLDLLGSLPGLDFVVPEEVLDEVTEPDQRLQLEAGMQAGWVRLLPLTDPAGIAIFARLRASLGKGESACLALAVTLKCAIACSAILPS